MRASSRRSRRRDPDGTSTRCTARAARRGRMPARRRNPIARGEVAEGLREASPAQVDHDLGFGRRPRRAVRGGTPPTPRSCRRAPGRAAVPAATPKPTSDVSWRPMRHPMGMSASARAVRGSTHDGGSVPRPWPLPGRHSDTASTTAKRAANRIVPASAARQRMRRMPSASSTACASRSPADAPAAIATRSSIALRRRRAGRAGCRWRAPGAHTSAASNSHRVPASGVSPRAPRSARVRRRPRCRAPEPARCRGSTRRGRGCDPRRRR